jgi:hypothetical protein
VLVEGECRDLLDFLKSCEPCMTPYGNLVDDIRWTASLFSDIRFSTNPHSCNMFGYMLAQEAFSFDCCKVWIEECPNFLLNFVQNDLLQV